MKTVHGFSLLETSAAEHKRWKVSFAAGCLVETAGIGLVVLMGVWIPFQMPRYDHRYAVIALASHAELRPILKVPSLPRLVARVIKLPKPLTPSLLRVTSRDVPKVEELPKQAKSPLSSVMKQPQPMAAAMPPPGGNPAQPKSAVHTGLLAQMVANSGNQNLPLKQVQTGGFGDPQGLAGEAQAGNPGNVPKLGAFDLPAGPGRGNGTGGLKGRPGIVSSAGFGGGGMGTGLGREPREGPPAGVKTGAFGAVAQSVEAPAKPLAATPPLEIQPVEILSKPLPQYTEEARQLRVQGEVVLSVVFQADGTLRVMGVVKSLGHGLDQMAEQAASQIRFKPAEQGGRPTDFPATLRIEFRLA